MNDDPGNTNDTPAILFGGDREPLGPARTNLATQWPGIESKGVWILAVKIQKAKESESTAYEIENIWNVKESMWLVEEET